jgi:hypothetical protein
MVAVEEPSSGRRNMELFAHDIKQFMLGAISNFQMNGRHVIKDMLRFPTAFEQALIKLGLQHQIVTEAELKEAVTGRIARIGADMARYSRRGEWADHVPSPEALAFAIAGNYLSAADRTGIRFDHSDTLETFMRDRIEGLVDDVYKQLLEPKERTVRRNHMHDEIM